MPISYQKKKHPITWKYQSIVPLYEWAWGTIIHDIPKKTITLTSATTGEQIVIADRNLWAEFYKDQYWDDLPKDKWYLWRWKIFQWWNCYWSEQTWSVTTSPASQSAVSLPNAWPWNRYSNSTFITWTSSSSNWETSNNKNLWWWLETKAINRAWPCSNPDYWFVWFHVPTDSEWLNLKALWWEIIWWIPQDSSWIALAKAHLLISRSPYYRDPSSWGLTRMGSWVPWFWTSTRYSSQSAANWDMFSNTYWWNISNRHINYWIVIRPFLSHIYSKNQILALSSIDTMASTMNEYPETYYEKYPELDWYTVSKKELDYDTTNDIWTYILSPIIHKDTQWPCPDYYHIGTKNEWQALITALTRLWAYNVSNIKTYLKIPDAYYLNRKDGTKNTSYWTCRFWTSTMTSNTVAWCWWIDENNSFIFQSDKPGNGFSIRPFKNNPVAPDNTWTLITTWIYWSSTLWLISIQNGSDWITIMDKNLWATNVWDNWLFYQFWNNTWYTYNASPYVTKKPTLSDNYWPGSYYTGKFVRVSSGNNWFNWTCNNIWWWVTDWDRDS